MSLALKRINLQDQKIKSQEKQMLAQDTKIRNQELRLLEQQSEIKCHQKYGTILMKRLNAMENKSKVPSSFTNTHIWKVQQFKKKLQRSKCSRYHEVNKCIYTSLGHRLEFTLFLYGNGNARSKSISIFAETVAGRYDHSIQWPMKAIIECHALNEKGDTVFQFDIDTKSKLSFSKPPHYGAIGWGLGDFIPLSEAPIHSNILKIKINVEYF